MRKLNTVLSVLLIIIFGIHGVMGGFMLIGTGKSAGKVLAWIGVSILAVHAAIGVYLTVKSLKTAINTDKKYLRENKVFWARRASGLAILILLFFHIGCREMVVHFIDPFGMSKQLSDILLRQCLIQY